jgi:acyl carrier protein
MSNLTSSPFNVPSRPEIKTWIIDYLSNLLQVAPSEVDPQLPFDSYGLDSSAAVGLTGDLQDWLGGEMDPTLLYDYPTVNLLVDYLVSYITELRDPENPDANLDIAA